MTTQDIQNKIQKIKDSAGDYEIQHGTEDDLYEEFIRYVSTLSVPLAEKAALVLSTKQIKFERYCA